MTGVIQERYEAGDSLLHRLDPRVKVIMTLLLIVGIVLTPERAWPAYPLLLALIASLAVTGQVSPWRLARLGALALPFALAAATLPFTMPGNPILRVAGLTVRDAGAIRFLSVLLKSWLSVQAALLLSITTHFTDLLWALSSLHLPGTLVAIISFMYRYLFTLKDEADRLLRARAARSGSMSGTKPGGSLAWRALVAGGMVGNLFLRSYERSERVYIAMLSRGYTGQMRVLDPQPMTRRSVIYGAVPILILVSIELLAVLLWSE